MLLCGCGQKEELSFEASYVIDADLDPEARNMTYRETVEIVNTGSGSTKELYFHNVFMEYPYDTLVVTNAAKGTNFGVNMEYPGLITVVFPDSPSGYSEDMKINTYHEVAHQWFYGLVGNDENKEPWLDEGFATFLFFKRISSFNC